MGAETPHAGGGTGEAGRWLACPRCGHVLAFTDVRPRFCSACGSALPPPSEENTAAADPPAEAPTLPPVPAATGSAEGEPESVGGYRLVRRLGGGGMGTVYEAEDAAGRRLALKLIAPGQELSADAVERFRREGRLASALSHPRCVFVYAADEDAGRPYIVMELMPGDTLADEVRDRGPLPTAEAVEKALDVLDGLREAHRLGIVHRDVKPSNCFVAADGRVKVGDFGLSKSLTADGRLTQTGSFLGTPLYASPEQVKGEAAGPQSDVYSLAATLYCLLAGRAPFEGGDAAATLARIAADPAPPLRAVRPEVPPGLERAVLRGLERDRRRRWRDLGEFRAALLPFKPGGEEGATPELRFTAYVTDSVFLAVLGYIVLRFLSGETGPNPPTAGWESIRRESAVGFATGTALGLGYFGLTEWLWGCTPGKRLLRLRVRGPTGPERPAGIRVLARYGAYQLLTGVGTLALLVTPAPAARLRAADTMDDALRLSVISTLCSLAGLALLLSTMRRRNGWRCLHDVLSGTRVVRLPEPARHAIPAAPAPPDRPTRAEDLPGRVGPFAVRGALRGDDGARVLSGEDPVLGRSVILWLRRPAGAPPAPARRECARPARPRWLAGGEQDGWRWDAFPAMPGESLADLVTREGPLSWPQFRPVLEQLVEELAAADDDGTLPRPLTVGQVWVRPGGDVALLDVALRPEGGPGGGGDEDRPPLALACEAAVLALEGRPRPAAGRVRAAVPEHAARLLGRLAGAGKPYRDVEELRAALAATRDKPAEVRRPRRAAQVVALGLLHFVGLVMSVFMVLVAGAVLPFGLLALLDEGRQGPLRQLEVGAARDFVGGVLAPPVLARPVAAYQFGADVELGERLRDRLDRDERQLRERIGRAGQLTRGPLEVIQEVGAELKRQAQQEETGTPGPGAYTLVPFRPGPWFREAAERRASARLRDEMGGARFALAVPVYLPLFWLALWVASAFVFRGGLTHWRMGLSLVRADGRRAGRLRCAWRALLVWGPVTAVLVAVARADVWYWTADIAASRVVWAAVLVEGLRWVALALLVAYPVLAILYPRRGLHDWLAGTYLVPR